MKKLGISLSLLALICVGGFLWLLSQSGPSHAPQEPVTVDLTDKIKR